MTIRIPYQIGLPISDVQIGPLPPGVDAVSRADVYYQHQTETNWCWAACASMVLPALGKDFRYQCEIAHEVLGVPCCPNPGFPSEDDEALPGCNQEGNPDSALKKFAVTPIFDFPLRKAVLQDKLAEKPVIVCYRWSGGGIHFAVIVGEYSDGQFLVFDPIHDYGPGSRDFAHIQSAYGLGRVAGAKEPSVVRYKSKFYAVRYGKSPDPTIKDRTLRETWASANPPEETTVNNSNNYGWLYLEDEGVDDPNNVPEWSNGTDYRAAGWIFSFTF